METAEPGTRRQLDNKRRLDKWARHCSELDGSPLLLSPLAQAQYRRERESTMAYREQIEDEDETMGRHRKMDEFDYEAAKRDAKARLMESPPTARVPHPDGETVITDYPMPPGAVEAIEKMWVIIDCDRRSGRRSTGYLKTQVWGFFRNVFEEGYEAALDDDRSYIQVAREGGDESPVFVEGDTELLDWLVRDVDDSATDQDVDEHDGSFDELLADLTAREER
jgi:hypothetical protein